MNGYREFIPRAILLKCQPLKEFGGGLRGSVVKAMLNAAEKYATKEKFVEMLVCRTADVAIVNFGGYKAALSRMTELLGWNIVKFHCFNHNLEI